MNWQLIAVVAVTGVVVGAAVVVALLPLIKPVLEFDQFGSTYDLTQAGAALTVAQARELEAYLEQNPDDLATRIKLYGFYEHRADRASVRRLLEQCAKLAPQNPEWPARLGRTCLDSMWRDQRGAEEWARKSLAACERALDRIGPHMRPVDEVWKLAALEVAARAALAAGDLQKARKYAFDTLEAAGVARIQRPAAYFREIHSGHLVLGQVALRAGQTEQAEEQLLLAANVQCGAHQGSFRPNMRLAAELLERGRTAAVLEYLRRCLGFGQRRQTEAWIKDIEAGRTPDFGASARP